MCLLSAILFHLFLPINESSKQRNMFFSVFLSFICRMNNCLFSLIPFKKSENICRFFITSEKKILFPGFLMQLFSKKIGQLTDTKTLI